MWFSTRPDINLGFYGRPISPSEILSRNPSEAPPPPVAAYPLYEALHKVTREFLDADGGATGRRDVAMSLNQPPPPRPPSSKPASKKVKKYRRVSILI
jgi:hypothetical protein